MSRSSKKTVLARRSVVELDLIGYSVFARDLEQQADATILFHLNDQVQRFVDHGLSEVGIDRRDAVNGTAGDNALLVFERASEAHRFSEAVHRATAKHNAAKNPKAHRNFRIGISTGEIALRGKEVTGTSIIDSVRLEAAGTMGHILIDEATYEELPAKFQQCYRGPEPITDKQKNAYRVYRFVVVEADSAGVVHSAQEISAVPGQALCPADISRIVEYAPAELIGRETELNILNDAWEKAASGESIRPRILTFVALGGEGKTSLVAKWAAELAHKDWRGCDAAFAWSFYSQGTREQLAASSDVFLKEALVFFGDDADREFAAGSAGAFEKAQRLARIVGRRRSLLILDGLEPLQYPYGSTAFQPGELKDQGVAKLLKDLATSSQGLCVVTTRIGLPDLKAFVNKTVREEKLTRLSRIHGVELLQKIGVQGSERRNLRLKDGDQESEQVNELEKLVEDVKGHALTLSLLGGFLKRAFRGDIRQRDRVKFEKADEKMDGGHAFRTMAAYEEWLLSDGGDEGRREVAVLRLMGLFDRPADADCLAALRSGTIPSLTEPLAGLADEDWEFCLSGLEDAKLLTINRDAAGGLASLDAHPHLREYFARQLCEQNPDAWREGHRRLYEHLCKHEEGERPTLEDLQPLYQAVAHGCHAGLREETCEKVYRDRINRGKEFYSSSKLGAIGSDLGAVACFFDQPWSRVAPSLTESTQAWLLNLAAYRLRALGRLTEALEPMRAGLKMRVKQEAWKNAASVASNLSEVELTLGKVAEAARDAEQSVTYADLSGDTFQRMLNRTTHADALHQAGRRDEALTMFREAEQTQTERQPEYPLLYSLQGFRYCDLLLDSPERAAGQEMLKSGGRSQNPELTEQCRSVSERATTALYIVLNGSRNLFDIALNHLTLGRAAFYEAVIASGGLPLKIRDSELEASINAAVDGFRRAGTTHWIPAALLTRAWLRFLTGRGTGPESAQEDLDEAWEIAERGSMKLFMADIHLYRAMLFGATRDEGRGMKYPWDTNPDGSPRGPKDDLAAARKLIESCGYWRRKEELEDAEAAAKDW
jgi:class 3 adenylate cyclase/tetratricopeptide (TPR) repeat protein